MRNESSASRVGIFYAALGVLCLAAAPAQAGWWDKAKAIFQDPPDETQTAAPSDSAGALAESDIAGGLKEALRVGADRVVSQLGRTDGFAGDPAIHIPLPDTLASVQSALDRVGMAGMLDDLELRLNRAAEIATPKAKALFGAAITDLSIDDVMGIYRGGDDAATRYFQRKMSPELALEMKPVVDDSLADAGAKTAYDQVMDRYNALPFVSPVEADLSDHVVAKGMDGLFHYLAAEEKAIRQDPAQRTTDLLRRVFGGD